MKTAEEILSEMTIRKQGPLSGFYWKTTVLEAMEEYTSQFRSEQHESEWIPVSERLPEVNEIVQFWRGKWILGKRVMVGDTTLWHYDGDTRYTYLAPTHWQPLPKPPKT